ncbi:hypothetical protein [Pseudomonas aeruginosa]|uniref:hypothetical protein n=2 Tax=Pseudomonas aeruginosa TaxID=287 RepID=UPI000E03186F|nr:hypothetical protein [Pseudomonas aeruginosa]MCO1763874.1 hypothetical protein [Pseudomonas aeruginosa]MCS7938900.1 hypothetical protein [Pseudomonas aeruginosa]MCV4037224.1 hypothetical protein [Pseudomonas aeruginosa]QYE69900.1 hypothetical protein KZ798_18430 [Pseudomonas aeruginosa]RCN12915.1 hypothetical protein C3O68_00533 [Pseudomonas aeruginosa]
MTLGPIPDYLKKEMRKHFLKGLKENKPMDTYALDLFQWFRQETEDTWQQMDAEEQAYIKEQVNSGAAEVNDSGILATEYYRKRMRASHVIFLASLLEGVMKQECDRVILALPNQVMFKPSELKGDAWSSRRTFLERHGNFSIPVGLWKPIESLLAVRNALAHHSGEVHLLTSQQISQLKNITGVAVDSNELEIDVKFLDNASRSVKDIAEYLHSQIDNMIDRAITPKPTS